MVQGQLKGANYEVFFPQMRTLASHKPLFPSYLFVRTDLENPSIHRMVRFTRGVKKILGDSGGPRPISDQIIETLIKRTRDGSIIEQELVFKEGDGVRVKRGMLRDLCGIIEKNLSDKGRVRVLFKWLSGKMRTDMPYTRLEKIA